jgi:hypothetical protein
MFWELTKKYQNVACSRIWHKIKSKKSFKKSRTQCCRNFKTFEWYQYQVPVPYRYSISTFRESIKINTNIIDIKVKKMLFYMAVVSIRMSKIPGKTDVARSVPEMLENIRLLTIVSKMIRDSCSRLVRRSSTITLKWETYEKGFLSTKISLIMPSKFWECYLTLKGQIFPSKILKFKIS